jgi:hypothetical protein
VGIPATILTGLGVFGLKKHIDSKKVNNQNELPSNGGNAVINNTAPIAEPDATEDAPVEEKAGIIPTPPPMPPIVTATKPDKSKKSYDA